MITKFYREENRGVRVGFRTFHEQGKLLHDSGPRYNSRDHAEVGVLKHTGQHDRFHRGLRVSPKRSGNFSQRAQKLVG